MIKYLFLYIKKIAKVSYYLSSKLLPDAVLYYWIVNFRFIVASATFPALVVKASGLAAGKGVVVASSKEEACEAVDEILTDAKYGAAGQTLVIEELLEGEEVSVSGNPSRLLLLFTSICLVWCYFFRMSWFIVFFLF